MLFILPYISVKLLTDIYNNNTYLYFRKFYGKRINKLTYFHFKRHIK